MSDLTRKDFKITWEIEISATSPEAAVIEVFKEFFRPGSDATIFLVEPCDGGTGPILVDVVAYEDGEQL